jgi:7-cyano-7-deazaguanine synthase in queuosine biosynthesis
MSEAGKAVVLLSGGMDSCVCTAIARKRHGAQNLALLHAMYGQRTEKRERQAFEQIADRYEVRQRLVLSWITSAPSEVQPSQTGKSRYRRMIWNFQLPAAMRFP